VLLVIDPVGNHWVKFVVKRVEPSNERPHGLSYSLTLVARPYEYQDAATLLGDFWTEVDAALNEKGVLR
jgi:hypothetical protein